MEHLNKRKPNLLFFWFLLPFILYGGYAVGKLEGRQITIENIRDMMLYSLTHPWPLRFTVLTIKAVLILLLIWVFAVVWYVGNYRSLIPGLEYGSAKFADPKRVNEKLEDTDEAKNKILSENIRMSIDTRKTGLNNNVTVIGGSGSGKSFHYVMPNGMKGDTSMVLTDPKGELYHKLGNILELKGYRVIAFNLVDMDNSDCYKFHTLESDEFALSTSLGMYDGKKQKDEAYEEEQVHFYIDAEGEDALEKSYRYQLENYGGIFKESNVFSHLEETQDGLYKIPFEYGGYMLKYESGQAEVLPAFDPLGMARIHAGGAVLSKIPVCGYYEEEMYTELTKEQEKELFVLRNRMTPAKRNLL